MTKNEILKKIGIIIIELREQYDLTQLNRDDINDIDLELFAANSHFLTDHIEILRKLNNQEIKPVRQQAPPEPKYFEPLVKTTIPERKEPEPDLPKDEDIISFTEPEPPVEEPVKQEPTPEPVIRHELILDEDDYTDDDEANAEEEWTSEEQAEVEPETEEPEAVVEEPAEQPLAEIPAEPEKIAPQPEVIKTQIVIEDADDKPLVTINQILSAQMPATRVGDHVEGIKDLKSAITLNDKLLFVRDLFNGYSMAYGEAVEILNRFTRFEEADQFLKLNYYTKNNWEAKQATTDKFYSLLQRRFPE